MARIRSFCDNEVMTVSDEKTSERESITLQTPLSLRASTRFPVQNAESRKEIIIGALWLLVPVVGWLLNMGHRIVFVHRMHNGLAPFPAWTDKGALLRHGAITFAGMLYYYTPAFIVGAVAYATGSWWLAGLALALALVATIAIPGYMTFYCRAFDVREIFDPRRALRRVREGGADYWRAWGIVVTLLFCSFVGLLGLGVGFLATSVWFWQSAGFSFATVFTRRHELGEAPHRPT
ncbi:MAG: hypothetical protein ACI9KE_006744 [Polyangiales bacterium]|jgi:hypothetical protein